MLITIAPSSTMEATDSVTRLKAATATLQCLSLVRGADVPPEAIAFVSGAIEVEVSSLDKIMKQRRARERIRVQASRFTGERPDVAGYLLDDDRVGELPDDLYRAFVEVQAIRRADGSLPPIEIIASWMRKPPDVALAMVDRLQGAGLLPLTSE